MVPLATGALGVALGAFYLVSPRGRLEVIVDDAGLEVGTPRRAALPPAWSDVVKVIASPTTSTCFVDGGDPERSLLVPGDGAPAPYDIADRDALYAIIVEHVDPAKLEEVELLATRGK